MKRVKRLFNADTLQHIYQISNFGRVIFYREEDYLLYYTILFVYSRRFNIKIAKICLMINHIHLLIFAENNSSLSKFMSAVTSVFVREYNSEIGRKGSLFSNQFGCASKEGGKKIRSCFLYIDNNPQEKKICKYAEDYRWNFLQYYYSNNPFSSKLVVRNQSYHFCQAYSFVNICRRKGVVLNYAIQRSIFCKLSFSEKEQMIDYIITSYKVIEYSMIEKYFGNKNDYLIALHSDTGKEFDLEEQWEKFSYRPFYNMIEIVKQKGYIGSNHLFEKMSDKELRIIIDTIRRKNNYSADLISMFLHIDAKHVKYLLKV